MRYKCQKWDSQIGIRKAFSLYKGKCVQAVQIRLHCTPWTASVEKGSLLFSNTASHKLEVLGCLVLCLGLIRGFETDARAMDASADCLCGIVFVRG